MTPDYFFVIGVPKAGTTSIYKYIRQCPEVCVSEPKETGYFRDHEGNRGEFERQFFSHCGEERYRAEFSAGNLFHPNSPSRIKTLFPNAHIFAILRDPVDRIYSHFNFEINIGIRRAGSDISPLIQNQGGSWTQRMIGLGMYHEQLLRYEDLSGERLHVFLFEDLVRDARGVVGRICEVLAIAPPPEGVFATQHNATRYMRAEGLYRPLQRSWRSLEQSLPSGSLRPLKKAKDWVRSQFFQGGSQHKPERSDADVQLLAGIYAEPNARLAEWLGRDLSHWTSPRERAV